MDTTRIDSPTAAPGATAGKSAKALWATIGALGVAVVALGGVLLHQTQGRDTAAASATPPPAVVASNQPVRAPDDFKAPVIAAPAPPAVPAPAPVPVQEPVRAPVAIAPEPMPAPAPAPAPAVAAVPAPVRAPAPARPVCQVCGHVESVRTVQHPAPTTGVGAVAGGVVGGVVGNQFGHGNGRVATTILGAVGGGFLGNTVEKHVRTVTAYEVQVRMANGSLRMVETQTAPPIGQAVTLEGNVLRPVTAKHRG